MSDSEYIENYDRDREVDAIEAAHPVTSGRHDLYTKAMRLVGERHAKGDLVDLVVWLLLLVEQAEALLGYCEHCHSAAGEWCTDATNERCSPHPERLRTTSARISDE